MKCNVITGQVFGKLTVIEEGVKFVQPSGQSQRGIVCKCECGNEKTIRLSHLTTGRVVSCGCIMPARKFFHERLYNTWRGMRNRCYGNKYNESRYYKDKGITVCDEWRNSYNVFAEWALNNGWNESSTIDRKDANKGYYPDNCRLVTQYENNLNKDSTIVVEYEGTRQPLMEILRQKGIKEKYTAILGRIRRGASVEKAINTPIRTGNYNYKNIHKNANAGNLRQPSI